MRTVHTDAQKQERLLVFTKGAPDVLLGRCSAGTSGRRNPAADRRHAAKAIRQANEELAGEALRRSGVAYRSLPADALDAERCRRTLEQDIVFAGLIG